MSEPVTLAAIMSSPVLTVRDDSTVWEAMQQFIESGLRHLVVVSTAGGFVGVLCDRTLLGQWPFDPARLHRTPVGSLTSGEDRGLPVHASLSDAAEAMLDTRIDAVAVVGAAGRPIGIVTGADLLRAGLRTADEPSLVG